MNFDLIEAIILDMDGVLWRGKQLLPGVAGAFEVTARRRLPTLIATNNATVTASAVVERLSAAGVEFPEARVLTSAQAAAGYIARSFPQPARVHVVGERPLIEALRQAGAVPVAGDDRPDVVVVGLDRSLDWKKLTEATLAIRAGAAFVGTNPDRTFPSERGLGPGNGAILASLQAATGVRPTIVGKPEPHLFLEGARRLGVEPSATLVVGDRLETDIVGGQRAGMPTALLLSGVTSREQAEASDIRPDLVFESLPEFSSWLDSP